MNLVNYGRLRNILRRDENFRAESLAFIEKVKSIKFFNEERWFSSAYSTLNARFTVEGGGLSEEAKKTLKNLLFSSIEKLPLFSVNNYDKWFYDLSKEINNNGYRYAVIINDENCNGCVNCALVCPDGVIKVYRTNSGKKKRELITEISNITSSIEINIQNNPSFPDLQSMDYI